MATRKLFAPLAACLLLAGVTSAAHAQVVARNEIYGAAGTEGLGLGYGFGISPNIGARAEIDGFGFSDSFNAGGLHYNGHVRLLHGAVLGDFFPAPQTFPVRLTAGLLIGDDRLSGDATSIAGTYTINGVAVPSTGESVHATFKFPAVRPYIGIGFGHNPTAAKGLSMAFDAGVAIGKPRVSFDVPADIAALAGAENVAAERQYLQSKANHYPVYPVVKIALTYRF